MGNDGQLVRSPTVVYFAIQQKGDSYAEPYKGKRTDLCQKSV